MGFTKCTHHWSLRKSHSSSAHLVLEATCACSTSRATRRERRQFFRNLKRYGRSVKTCWQTCKAEPKEIDVTAVEVGKESRRVQDDGAEYGASRSHMRPWSFLIPTLDEVANNKDWHLKVADWKTFWAMFNNWLWVYQQLVFYEENNLGLDPDVEEQMEWLQIDVYILSGRVDKLERVIDSVVERLQELKQMGYPIPNEIAGKFPGFTGSRARKYKVDDQGNKFIEYGKVESNRPMFDAKPVVQEKADGSEFSDISRPWDDWNEWEHRVHLEKQRMHRQKRAKFAKKQAEVGKWKHLVVSPSTDSRWAEESYFYPINERDYTHEEIMSAVQLQGKAVDPLKIPIQVVDPHSYADGFREGVHFVPDTIDYVREIGHLAESEEELIGERHDNLPSATLDEEFADEADSTLNELDDLDDGPGMEGMDAVVGGGDPALEADDS